MAAQVRCGKPLMLNRVCRLAVLLLAMSWGVAFARRKKGARAEPAKEPPAKADAPKDAKRRISRLPRPLSRRGQRLPRVQAKTFLKRIVWRSSAKGDIRLRLALLHLHLRRGAGVLSHRRHRLRGFVRRHADRARRRQVAVELLRRHPFREETGYLILAGLLWSPFTTSSRRREGDPPRRHRARPRGRAHAVQDLAGISPSTPACSWISISPSGCRSASTFANHVDPESRRRDTPSPITSSRWGASPYGFPFGSSPPSHLSMASSACSARNASTGRWRKLEPERKPIRRCPQRDDVIVRRVLPTTSGST